MPAISKEILNTIIDYIERVEVQIDGEWGTCQTLEELVEAGEMPEFYNDLKIISENVEARQNEAQPRD